MRVLGIEEESTLEPVPENILAKRKNVKPVATLRELNVSTFQLLKTGYFLYQTVY